MTRLYGPIGVQHIDQSQPKVASPGQFPWAVSLRRRRSSGQSRHTCAGSLVTSRHVVTAAHCLHKTTRDQWEAVVGEYRPESSDSQEKIIQVGICIVY